MPESRNTIHHRNKVAAAWLASILGLFSVHWWYLGRSYAWVMSFFAIIMLLLTQFYPVWWNNPPFLLLFLPVSAGIIESVVLALTPDQKFDQRYNKGSARHTKTGWNAVIAAIAATFLGGTVIIFGLSMAVIYVYKTMGWLDEFVL